MEKSLEESLKEFMNKLLAKCLDKSQELQSGLLTRIPEEITGGILETVSSATPA